MIWMLKRSLILGLLLISCGKLQAASPLTSLDSNTNYLFTPQEIENLAAHAVQCKATARNLEACNASFTELKNSPCANMSWYQEPWVVIGGVAVGIGLGAVIGLLIAN